MASATLWSEWEWAVAEYPMGVLGATSLVGECLLPLLTQAGWRVAAFSRRQIGQVAEGVEWRCLSNAAFPSPPDPETLPAARRLPLWICVAPIWVLPEHFALLSAHGARRVVALSSTSRFTKDDSSDQQERAVAHRLAEAEARLQAWAEDHGVEWVILRPTLIYGRGQDKNIAELARFIQRFGFFPLLGEAIGARQPVHAEDVAWACLAGLHCAAAANRAYNISGGETLPYREMVRRVFAALHLRPRLFAIPLTAFKSVLALLRLLPRYRHWSGGMAERMNRDLVFDHTDAARDLGFSPRPFLLGQKDLPR